MSKVVGILLLGCLALVVIASACNKTRKDTNKPPVITDLTANPAGLTVEPEAEVTLTLVYTDADETAPDPQTYSYDWTVEALPGTTPPADLASSLLINDANPALWKAPTAPGSYRVTGQVCDRFDDCSSRAISFSVERPNHAPRITSSMADTVTPALNAPVTLTVVAVDDDGDTLHWDWAANKGNFQNRGEGSAVWVGDAAGAATITATVTDPKGLSASVQFGVTVQP